MTASTSKLHPRWHAATRAAHPAIVLADTGRALSYRGLVENSDRAAQLLRRLGLVEGDTIGIHLENHIRYPELCWAAKNSGIYYACISSQSSVDDAVYIVENSDAKVLISSQALGDTAVEIAKRCGPKVRYLMVDEPLEPFSSYEALLDAEEAIPLTGRKRGPSMLYSSGTTGRPKGIRTPLPGEPPETPPRRLEMLVQKYGLGPDTVLINPGPMYHAAPGRFMLSTQRTGGITISARKFDAEGTLRAIHEHRATHGVFVPTMFIRMLQLPVEVRRRYNVSSLRHAIHLAAPCPIPVKEQMIEWWGPVIEEMYSGTEAVGHTTISSAEWLLHKGSVGRAANGCLIRIVGDDGHDLPPFQPGAIYMSNGQRFEYYKDPAKTRGAHLDAEWATLGDIGYLDNYGYLYLTDRISHMIISGGVNVYPQEAENVLTSHPAVADVAVIGIPHPEFGEEVKAVVQPKQLPSDPKSLAEELISYCRSRLSPIKCPRTVDFVDELPRNEAGKLLKRLVKDRYWQGRSSKII